MNTMTPTSTPIQKKHTHTHTQIQQNYFNPGPGSSLTLVDQTEAMGEKEAFIYKAAWRYTAQHKQA